MSSSAGTNDTPSSDLATITNVDPTSAYMDQSTTYKRTDLTSTTRKKPTSTMPSITFRTGTDRTAMDFTYVCFV